MATKTYTGISPIKVPQNEKIVSIAFPSEASSITSIDIPETATIDVTACNDTFVHTLISIPTMTNKVNTANNKIYYLASAKLSETTSDKSSGLHTNKFGVSMVSHEFSNGKGVITFTTDVTSIGNRAFDSCSGLTSITIPDKVTSIGDWAFKGCRGLTSVTIGNGVTSIGSYAFSGCSGLTSISLGNRVTSIGADAFSGCSGLTSITIPDSMTSIGGSAFNSCSGLTSITIPDSVTSISGSAFYNCRSLTSIIFKGTTAQWNAITKDDSWNTNVPTTC